MSEFLKSFVAWALSPLVLALSLQLAAWFLRSRRRTALSLAAAGWTLLLVGSLPVLSYESNRSRERIHPPLDASKAAADAPAAIVVLGTGFNPDPELPANSRVSGGFHARLLEGLRLFRELPQSRLIVSVANIRASREDKEAFLAGMLALLQVDPGRVELIAEAESTEDEARLASQLLRPGEPLVLATSAGHMPRAMATFANAGFEPIAAPCDFVYPRRGSPNDRWWRQWIPSAGGAGSTQQMLYETTASLKQRLAP